MKKHFITFILFISVLFTSVGAQNIAETEIWICRIGMAGNLKDFSEAINITNHIGYDNQPCFTPDSKFIYYVSNSDNQTDVHRLNLENVKSERITNTKESEYSPTPLDNLGTFSAVRVEKDSIQRLRSFSSNKKKPKLLFKNITKIGYHAWLNNDTCAFFILNEPEHELWIGSKNSKYSQMLDKNIGRCISKIPSEKAISYVSKSEKEWKIMRYDSQNHIVSPIVSLPNAIEDYAWSPWNTIWAFQKGKLFQYDPAQPNLGWKAIKDFSATGPGNFYRLAVSPDGKWMAFVSIDGEKP